MKEDYPAAGYKKQSLCFVWNRNRWEWSSENFEGKSQYDSVHSCIQRQEELLRRKNQAYTILNFLLQAEHSRWTSTFLSDKTDFEQFKIILDCTDLFEGIERKKDINCEFLFLRVWQGDSNDLLQKTII